MGRGRFSNREEIRPPRTSQTGERGKVKGSRDGCRLEEDFLNRQMTSKLGRSP